MENFPNLKKKKKSHTNRGNTESPKQEETKEATARHIIIKKAKFQDKERTLIASRENRKEHTREPQ